MSNFTCNATCSGSGYYIQDSIICKECSNPRCKTCNSSTTCADCDSTRVLNLSNDCVPASGYYENNLTIADSCCANCQTCQNSTSCDTCINGYVYSANTSNC